MKKLFLTVLAFIFFGFLFAQSDIQNQYAAEITVNNLKKQLTIIASPEMEGRMTGTKGQRKAAQYIQSQFELAGLESPEELNGYQQYYPFLKDTLLANSLKIGNQKFEYGKDFALFSGGSVNEKFNAGKVVFCGYGIDDKNYNDYAGQNVNKKVVVIIDGEPVKNGKYISGGISDSAIWLNNLSRKIELARRKGAVAVLFINSTWDSVPVVPGKESPYGTAFYPINGKELKLTTVLLASTSLQYLFGENEAKKIIKKVKFKEPLNRLKIEKKLKIKLSFGKERIQSHASNVIGIIKGSAKKDEYVYVTAHYDHMGKDGNVIYYGADDDGSGTAAVIEIARAFSKAKKDGNGPERTIVFVTFSGEEEGLLGSKYYTNNPLFPFDKTSVDLNMDMIGRIDGNRYSAKDKNYIYVVGANRLSSELEPIINHVNNSSLRLQLNNSYNSPNDPEQIFYRSDHYNFARNGVPVLFYFDGIHKDYHKPTDTVDKINFKLMEKRVRLVFLTAWNIANRNEMIKRDKSL